MSSLKTIRYPVPANLKIMLVVFALAIVAGTLLYTQGLVNDLRRAEQKTVRFYVNTLQKSLSTSSPEMSDLNLMLFETIDFPVILTDTHNVPLYGRGSNDRISFNDYVRNIDLDTALTLEQQRKVVQARLQDMSARYKPLGVYSVTNQDSTLINYMYYDDSPSINQLRLLPYIQLIIGSMFILVGYLSFSYIKRNEQSNIWVGMAKETAHQLGTPISSLMGWVELLRYAPEDRAQVLEASDEMERDVERLNKVAQRFSKIGAAPELSVTEINGVINGVVAYFQRRLPHLGRRVTLSKESDGPINVAVNAGLMEWVFENLIRNAADAIDVDDGQILVSVLHGDGTAVIDVSDNGRGIDPKVRKHIFRPGFSTKKRGWGLGLSLAKRIVEEYHGGKITLHESSPEGSTFRIRLRTNNGKPT